MSKETRFQLQISERRLLLVVGDAIANLLAVLLALRIWAFVGERDYQLGFIVLNAWWFFVLGGLWFLLASANDFYDLSIAANPLRSATRLVQITFQMVIVYLIIFFLSPREELPRLFILYYGFLSFLFVTLWRIWRPFLIGWTSSARRVLVIGSGWAARAIIEVINQEAKHEYSVAAVVTDPSTHSEITQTVTFLRDDKNLTDILARLGISEIVLAYGSDKMPGHIFQGIMEAYEQGYAITHMPLLYEQITGRVPIEHVGEYNWNVVLPVSSNSLFNPYPLLKRIFDVTLALMGSIIFAFMLPFLALMIYIDLPGDIFYRQERLGKGGRPFKILKLRTMIPDAEESGVPQWASQGDARVTKVGRLLRKTRLDEMPQLINVLRGEMSLVGPRPERAYFVEQLSNSIPFYRTRHIIKPGVTGWAQVRYNYGNTTEDALVKLQYDLYYIRHQSLILDMLIILRTVRKVLAFAGQ